MDRYETLCGEIEKSVEMFHKNPKIKYIDLFSPAKGADYIFNRAVRVNGINVKTSKAKKRHGYFIEKNKLLTIFYVPTLPMYMQEFVKLHELSHCCHSRSVSDKEWWSLNTTKREVIADTCAMMVWDVLGGDWGQRPNYLGHTIVFDGLKKYRRFLASIKSQVEDYSCKILNGELF